MGDEVDERMAKARLQRETEISDFMLMAVEIENRVDVCGAPSVIKTRLKHSADRIREACESWERAARKPQALDNTPHPARSCIMHGEPTLLNEQGECPLCMEAE